MNSTEQVQHPQFLFINQLSLMDAALAYAAKGIRVFPLQQNSKIPMAKWPWKKIATTDPVVIRAWWELFPKANIGMAMGHGSALDALDIDVKKGQDGTRSYQAITQERYTGPVQITPSKGSHLLFLHHPGLINFTRKGTLGGLDMRTDGGYILGSPSIVDNQPYYWTQDGDIPAMPASLRTACEQWSTQAGTTIVEAPDIPEQLPDITTLGLKSKYLNYLQQGDTDPWGSDESRAIFAVAGALMRKLNSSEDVFGIMSDNIYAWACAERHREFGNPGDWLWKYGISKIVAEAAAPSAADVFQPLAMQIPQTPGASEHSTHEVLAEHWRTKGSEGIVKARFAPDWIVRGLIERGQVGLIYGDSQALKSYACLDLAACIAMGGNWHGHDVIKAGKVLFIAGEGNVINWRRLEAYRQRHRIHSDQLENLELTSSGLNLMDTTHLQFLKTEIEAMDAPPELIIVDTLARNAILDENNARDISELVDICDRIAKMYNCSILLVHHTGKTNKGNARGSSALEANTDFRFKMERLEGTQEIRTRLDVQKLKGAPEPTEPIVFQAITTTLMGVHNDNGTPVTDLVLERVGVDVLREHVKKKVARGALGIAMKIALDAAATAIYANRSPSNPDAGVIRQEIWTAFLETAPPGKKIDQSNFNKTVDRLVEKQWLTLSEDAGGTAWYNLPKGDDTGPEPEEK